MMRIVQGGAQERLHTGVHDDDAMRAIGFFVIARR